MAVFDFRSILARLNREPMQFHGRVSSDQADAGSRNFCDLQARGYKILVFLDGVEQKVCDTADPIEGMVRRCLLDSTGNIYAIGDQIAQETVYGKVEIKIAKAD